MRDRGCVGLDGAREFPTERLLAMTGAIAPSRAGRRADPHRAGRRPGRPSALDRRPRGRPAAALATRTASIWVAFNGELFEYPELRQELLARGHRLSTRCDTEALGPPLRGPRRGDVREGPGPVRRLALGPARTRTLILGRDRVGICPLYYAEVDGWLLWGSEIKALLASGMVAARPDVRGIDHLLHVLLRGHDADVLRGDQVAPAGPLT